MGVRIGRINDRQFRFAGVLRKVGHLAFLDGHPLLDGAPAHETFAEHQQGQSCVNQHHAAAPFENEDAADQQHDGGKLALDQLPQNAHPRIAQVGTVASQPQPSQQSGDQNRRCAEDHEFNDPRSGFGKKQDEPCHHHQPEDQ